MYIYTNLFLNHPNANRANCSRAANTQSIMASSSSLFENNANTVPDNIHRCYAKSPNLRNSFRMHLPRTNYTSIRWLTVYISCIIRTRDVHSEHISEHVMFYLDNDVYGHGSFMHCLYFGILGVDPRLTNPWRGSAANPRPRLMIRCQGGSLLLLLLLLVLLLCHWPLHGQWLWPSLRDRGIKRTGRQLCKRLVG
jgi:hypothetical protein